MGCCKEHGDSPHRMFRGLGIEALDPLVQVSDHRIMGESLIKKQLDPFSVWQLENLILIPAEDRWCLLYIEVKLRGSGLGIQLSMGVIPLLKTRIM